MDTVETLTTVFAHDVYHLKSCLSVSSIFSDRSISVPTAFSVQVLSAVAESHLRTTMEVVIGIEIDTAIIYFRGTDTCNNFRVSINYGTDLDIFPLYQAGQNKTFPSCSSTCAVQ
jgi:hypothetical protein